MVFFAGSAWVTSGRGDNASRGIQELLRGGLPAVFLERRPDESSIFADEDLISWVVFAVVLTVLVIADKCVWHRKAKEPTFRCAVLHTLFWILCAVAFNVYIYFSRGAEPAVEWATGYILEFMLSVDNLFVFHRIFEICSTPSTHKHACLFWGILGSIVFRMLFLFAEQALLHSISWMHYVLGAFLIYAGCKALLISGDAQIPEGSLLMKVIAERCQCVNYYDEEPSFFIKVRIDPRTGLPWARRPSPHSGQTPRPILRQSTGDESRTSAYSLADGTETKGSLTSSAEKLLMRADTSASLCTDDAPMTERPSLTRQKTPRFKEPDHTDFQEPPEFASRGTKLLVVVMIVEIVDIIFAVDSVSTIVAQIPSLFLSYTACVFAMLGLRTFFFLVEELVKLFTLLSYGVAAILLLTGAKLCLQHWIHIDAVPMFIAIVSIFLFSMLASVAYEDCIKTKESDAESQNGISAVPTSRSHSLPAPCLFAS